VAAPGEQITSLGSEGQPLTLGGTSAAAPCVTGAIALVWSQFPSASGAELRLAFMHAQAGRSTVTPPLLDAWAAYHVSETRHDSQPTSTEPTFYPVTKTLLSAILKEGRLPFEVRVNTSETKGKAHDMPDFVLGDDKMFVGVYGEVKRANVLLEDLALSPEQNDQIGRYLARRTCGVSASCCPRFAA
jgi:hypothetical protein